MKKKAPEAAAWRGSNPPIREERRVWYLAATRVLSAHFRTWLTILGVSVGTFALTTMGSMAIHFHKMADRFDAYVGGKLFIREEAGFFGAGALPEAELSSLKAERGVERVIPILVSRWKTRELFVLGLPKIVLGLPVNDVPVLFKDVRLVWGRWPRGRQDCVIGADIAEETGENRILAYLGGKFSVCGLMARTSGQEDEEVIVPLPTLEKLLGRKGLVSYGIVVPDGNVSLPDLAAAIMGDHPHLQVLSPGELEADVKRSEMLWNGLTVGTGIIAALVGGIGILTVMMMSVQERIKEIAVTKALGAGNGQIFALFLCEAFILSVIGSAIGFFCGFVFVREANTILAKQGTVLFEPTLSLALFDLVLTVILSLVGGLYPAWYGARMEIASALRR